jgi:hypothetical protein
VAEDSHTGLRLYRTPGRYVRIIQIVDGLYPDAWSGSSVGYQRYGCRGGSVVVTLTSDRVLHPTSQLVTVTEGTREVARRTITPAHDRGQHMVVPLRGQGGLCAVRFTVTPTAVPALVLNNGDTRELGIRFTKFVFRPR